MKFLDVFMPRNVLLLKSCLVERANTNSYSLSLVMLDFPCVLQLVGHTRGSTISEIPLAFLTCLIYVRLHINPRKPVSRSKNS
jgi:hypothetical protein